jgi:hypothetical protein
MKTVVCYQKEGTRTTTTTTTVVALLLLLVVVVSGSPDTFSLFF